MRPSLRRWCLSLGLCLATLAGCQDMNLFRFQSPDDKAPEDSLSRVLNEERAAGRRSLIKDYTAISGNKVTILEGVGLVTQLDGTGGDAPSTNRRKELLDEMRRMQIDNPNAVLRSPYTAMVIVTAYLPALVEKGETFDVAMVRLPDGSEATSLAGGWLMKCDLWEKQVVPGRGVMTGKRLARCQGPILITADLSRNTSKVSGVMRGTIPAGAVCLRDEKPLAIHLRSDYRSVRMANRMTQRIGKRFYDYDEYGIRRPLARFRADSRIDLEVHPRYKDNTPRYLEVVRNIAFNETKVERRLRTQRLQQELMNGPTAEKAALQLEAIGREAIPFLKEGLQAATLESRFHAAIALAYLGEDDGIEILAEAAAGDRAFRVHAFAAMAALDGGEAYQPLIDLLQSPSIETRYGAFRTLTTLNPNDPAVRAEDMNDQFTMHLIPSEQAPLVHLTRRQKTELVLFGEDQRFKTPLAINAGKHIWITSPTGQDHVVVSRHEIGKDSRRIEVSAEIAEVIRTVTDLGASYPDVVQMLIQAERQHNLPGKIAIDALPQAGRNYYRPNGSQSSGSRSTRVGHENLSPDIFPQTGEDIPEDVEADASTTAVRGGDSVDGEARRNKAGDEAKADNKAGDEARADNAGGDNKDANTFAEKPASPSDPVAEETSAEETSADAAKPASRLPSLDTILSTLSAYDE